MHDINEFVRTQADKILLVALVVFFVMLGLHGSHHGDSKFFDFAIDNAKLFAGALLTLITGSRLMQRNGDGTKPPSDPSK